ncbi:MAG: hypothetical protein U1E50_18495 [Caulobacteraceae bacterium]
MNLRLAAACAAMSFAFAGAAIAAVPPTTATLETPVAAPKQIAAGGAIWNCAGSTCVSSGANQDSTQVTTCRVLVRKLGKVTAFASARRTLDADELTRCNAVAG